MGKICVKFLKLWKWQKKLCKEKMYVNKQNELINKVN